MRALKHNNKIVIVEEMDKDTFVGVDDLMVYKASDFEIEKSPEEWASDLLGLIDNLSDDETDQIIESLEDFD